MLQAVFAAVLSQTQSLKVLKLKELKLQFKLKCSEMALQIQPGIKHLWCSVGGFQGPDAAPIKSLVGISVDLSGIWIRS